ncbi:hypothetical protein PAXRUDRAFT_770388 [Paxillus rubicundulus Ve08.2h10]|uniref:Uncharacterized protein n=1 Tax=Paxillus rubicundulus Ve08.2h10 TaxID=930991 RepID=A0A0D0D694_9AGAM|nr:hypothetical protein PAXRUDRAFT_770388 [Paxillus rubicundulus Ve08.2h10]
MQTMLLELQDIISTRAILTRALSITVQHIVIVPGQSKVPRHNAKHSLSMVDTSLFSQLSLLKVFCTVTLSKGLFVHNNSSVLLEAYLITCNLSWPQTW